MKNESGLLSTTTGEAVEKYRLVYLSGNKTVQKCYPGRTPLGVMEELTASGSNGSVRLLNNIGSLEMMANAAIAINSPVWCVEDGKIDDVGIGPPLGWALEAATVDGQVIEVLLNPGGGLGFAGIGDIVVVEDEFSHYDDTATDENWVLVAGSDGGTCELADRVGGSLELGGAGATDNDEVYLEGKTEMWLFAAAKPLYFQARVTLTEANTDDANIIVGLTDAVASDLLLDDGAGPKASGSSAYFFKVDGGTVWQAETSISTTQVTDTNAGAFTSGTQHKLEIIFVPTSATAATVHFLVDGTLGASNAMTFTGATEMQIVFGVKNGGANEENLFIDYVYCAQVR